MQKGFFPLKSNKVVVLASCRFFGRALIHIFRCQNLDDAYIYPGIVRVNFRLTVLPHIYAPKLASERSESLDDRRVLSVSNSQKC